MKEEKAWAQLKNLKMKGNLINEYVSDFEDLVRMASYATGSTETMAMFLNGVDPGILCEIMKPPVLHDYCTLWQKAVDAMKARQAVDNILKHRGLGWTVPRVPFRPPQQQQQQQQQNHPYQGNWHNNQFNSSNAPWRFNNTPVPMDVDCGQMNRGRGGLFRGWVIIDRQRGNLQQADLACFNCGKIGHFAWNCPDKVQTANLLGLAEADYEPSEETPKEQMNHIQIELNNMSMEEKIALGKAMKDKDSLDFPAT